MANPSAPTTLKDLSRPHKFGEGVACYLDEPPEAAIVATILLVNIMSWVDRILPTTLTGVAAAHLITGRRGCVAGLHQGVAFQEPAGRIRHDVLRARYQPLRRRARPGGGHPDWSVVDESWVRQYIRDGLGAVLRSR